MTAPRGDDDKSALSPLAVSEMFVINTSFAPLVFLNLDTSHFSAICLGVDSL